MSRFNNAMEVFKLLEKSNCQECYKRTCLAFAGAVFKGEKRLDECPRLPADIIEQFKDMQQESSLADQGASQMMEDYKKAIANIDLSSKAAQLGGIFSEGRLTIKVMGKNVSVDSQGKVFTDIHANHWVVMPLL
ncbi:MAG: Fe-S cluster protein, partial [Desulfamplus sp.]|nr:Fe-S cluster protein [Desulfamplus sp.]